MREAVSEDVPPSMAKRLLLRFGFVYLVLYTLPFPLDLLSAKFNWWTQAMWDSFVPSIANAFFGREASAVSNGSGDSTYSYVLVVCIAVIAVAIALIWSAADRSAAHHRQLYEIFRIFVRFTLAASMLSYGAFKVIPSQFIAPTLDRLVQPFGDASPMGLLWTFMGFSRGYEFFAGAAEVAGGLLLTTRRTALLGALVSAAVLSNIVAMNFFFDVPVKIYSLHLLAMALIVAVPDLRRLADFFIFSRGVEPVAIQPRFRRPSIETVSLMARTLFVIALFVIPLKAAQRQRKMFGDLAPRSPVYGIWNVTELEVDGIARPPLVSDESRWRRLVFDLPVGMSIQLMSDERQRFRMSLDEKKRTMTLRRRADSKWKSVLAYDRPRSDVLLVNGMFDGHRVNATCRLTNKKFLLTTRGFHWINESPFNR